MVKHELRVASYKLLAQAQIQKSKFKSMSYKFKSTKSNSQVTSSTLRGTSSSPRVQETFNQ